jgi:MFS family permease
LSVTAAARRLGWRGGEALLLAGLASFFVSLDSSTLTLALPAISHDFHAGVPALSDMGSVLALGALAGLPLGVLADRVGRRRLLILGVAGFSLLNVASGFAGDLATLTGLRLAASCLESAASAVAVVFVVEEVPSELRGLAVSGLTIAAGAGIGVTTLLWPLLTPNWRAMYFVGGAGVMAAVLLAFRLRESQTWTRARRAGTRPSRLLLARPWRRRLAVMLAAAALGALFYTPAGMFVVLFGSRLGLAAAALSAVIVVSGILSIPAFPIGGRLSDRFGRRRLAPLLTLATALFAGFTFLGGAPGYWAGNVIWSVLASAVEPVVGAWYGELFPTRARATSEAMRAVAVAGGGIAGLQLVAALTPRVGLGVALAACVAAPVLAAGLLLLLPETRAEPLPD